MTFREWKKHFERTRRVKLSVVNEQLKVAGPELSTQDLALVVGNRQFLIEGNLDAELTQAHTERALLEMGIERIVIEETYDNNGRYVTERTAFTHVEGDDRMREILLGGLTEQLAARDVQLDKINRTRRMSHAITGEPS